MKMLKASGNGWLKASEKRKEKGGGFTQNNDAYDWSLETNYNQ